MRISWEDHYQPIDGGGVIILLCDGDISGVVGYGYDYRCHSRQINNDSCSELAPSEH